MNQEGLMFPKTQKKRKKKMKHPKSIIHEKNGTCYLCMLLDGNYKKHLLLDEIIYSEVQTGSTLKRMA